MSGCTVPYYTVDQVNQLVGICVILSLAVGGLVGWAVKTMVEARLRRRARDFSDEVRDAKGNVVAIANHAQAEMMRRLVDGRMRRDGR